MKRRRPKDDDQKRSREAYLLLCELVSLNNQIEASLWVGPLLSAVVNSYLESDLTYEAFCGELDAIKLHYKHRWHK